MITFGVKKNYQTKNKKKKQNKNILNDRI